MIDKIKPIRKNTFMTSDDALIQLLIDKINNSIDTINIIEDTVNNLEYEQFLVYRAIITKLDSSNQVVAVVMNSTDSNFLKDDNGNSITWSYPHNTIFEGRCNGLLDINTGLVQATLWGIGLKNGTFSNLGTFFETFAIDDISTDNAKLYYLDKDTSKMLSALISKKRGVSARLIKSLT